MDSTTLGDIKKMEHIIIKEIFLIYIKPKNPTLTLDVFKHQIEKPLKSKSKTQKDVIDEENAELEEDEESFADRCHFIVLDRNRMRRCRLSASDEDVYCHLHIDKENTLGKSYFALKQKIASETKE